MDKHGKSEDAVQKKKKKKILLLILLLIVMLGIGIVVMHQFGLFHYPWEKPLDYAISGKKGMLPGLSEDEILAMLQEDVDKSKVRIQMNTEPTQQENGQFDFMIQNLETNSYDQSVKIYLGEDSYGDLLFDSGRIAPGYFVDYDSIQTTLEPGTYDAIAYVTFFDGSASLSTTTIDMKITVNK